MVTKATPTFEASETREERLYAQKEIWLPDEEQKRLSELLASNRERNLSSSEESELEALLDRVQAIARESAEAQIQLKLQKTA